MGIRPAVHFTDGQIPLLQSLYFSRLSKLHSRPRSIRQSAANKDAYRCICTAFSLFLNFTRPVRFRDTINAGIKIS